MDYFLMTMIRTSVSHFDHRSLFPTLSAYCMKWPCKFIFFHSLRYAYIIVLSFLNFPTVLITFEASLTPKEYSFFTIYDITFQPYYRFLPQYPSLITLCLLTFFIGRVYQHLFKGGVLCALQEAS